MATQEELKNALTNKDEIYTKFKTLVNKINTLCYPSEFGDVSYYGLLRDIVKFLIDMSKVWDITDNLVNDTIANYDKKWEDINNQWTQIQNQFEEMTQENQDFKNGINQEFNEFKETVNQELNKYVEKVELTNSTIDFSANYAYKINGVSFLRFLISEGFNVGSINANTHIVSNVRPNVSIKNETSYHDIAYLDDLTNGTQNFNSKEYLYINGKIMIRLDNENNHAFYGNTTDSVFIVSAYRPNVLVGNDRFKVAYSEDLINKSINFNGNESYSLSDYNVIQLNKATNDLNVGDVNNLLYLHSSQRPIAKIGNDYKEIAYLDDITDSQSGIISQLVDKVDPVVTIALGEGERLGSYDMAGVELTYNDMYLYLEMPLEVNVLSSGCAIINSLPVYYSCKITEINETAKQLSFETTFNEDTTTQPLLVHKVILMKF